eukprot:1905614-Rhodomonas_salina.2
MSCGVHAAVLFALLLLHSVDAFQHVSFQRLARCRGDGALGLCACDGDTNPKVCTSSQYCSAVMRFSVCPSPSFLRTLACRHAVTPLAAEIPSEGIP